jgi:putative hydrolase of the HAD superfamily
MRIRPAILIDLGGVLVDDDLTAVAADWGRRLGITPDIFLAAVFGGNDGEILVGRTGEAEWWTIVAGRLPAGADLTGEIRRDLAARRRWDTALLARLRRLHGRARIAVVSNAWPGIRASIADAGLPDCTDAIVLSCEVGCAKPDPRIYRIALDRIGADPAEALFIDDTPGHVDAALALGMTGHLHTTTEATLGSIDAWME